ncbi:hypothetical protein D3C86_1888260 [compost metagenome]
MYSRRCSPGPPCRLTVNGLIGTNSGVGDFTGAAAVSASAELPSRLSSLPLPSRKYAPTALPAEHSRISRTITSQGVRLPVDSGLAMVSSCSRVG